MREYAVEGMDPGTRYGAVTVVELVRRGSRRVAVVACDAGHRREMLPGNLRRGAPICSECEALPETKRARFMAMVRVSPSCWTWLGAFQGGGYGTTGIAGKQTPAHRAAYLLFVGAIERGKQIDHLCRNRACVRPEHLQPVTPRENLLRSPLTQATKNRHKSHCDHGHEFAGDNLTIGSDGHRRCAACIRERIYPSHARR